MEGTFERPLEFEYADLIQNMAGLFVTSLGIQKLIDEVKKLINKDNVATEILFTSCGTESDNAAILSALATRDGRRKIVTSRIEHPAILSLCKELARKGYGVTIFDTKEKSLLLLWDAGGFFTSANKRKRASSGFCLTVACSFIE